MLLKASCSFCGAAKRKHSGLLGELSSQCNLRTKTLNTQITKIPHVLSFLLLTSLYIFLSLALLVSSFCPWEPWFTPSSSVDGAAPSLLCSQQRGWCGSPLLFIRVVQRSHWNICFPNNYYSQWGSNAQCICAADLSGVPVASEADHSEVRWPAHGWLKKTGSDAHILQKSWADPFFSSIVPCPGFSSPPHSLSYPISTAFLFLLAAALFSFLSLFLSVYFHSSFLLVFTIFLMFCHLFSVYIFSNLNPVMGEKE